MKVQIGKIRVKDRFRVEFGSLDSLAMDIKKHGLYHPIIVTRLEGIEEFEFELRAGERRLRAHKLLGLSEIEVKLMENVDEITGREIEIEENIQRKDFTWQEEIAAKAELHSLKQKLYGVAVKGHGGGWSLRATAESVGESVGTLSQDIKLAEAIQEFPALAAEKSKGNAWKKFQRMRERGLTSALAGLTRVGSTVEALHLGDALTEMRKLPDASVDLICTDPPYGINLDKSMKSKDHWGDGGIYADAPRDWKETIASIVGECYRVLREDRHMYVFFAIQYLPELRDMLEVAGFDVNPSPLIWHKTGGGGTGGGDYSWASNYEAFFMCMKGRRPLTQQGQSNVLLVPRVAPQKKIHPAQKPVALLRRLIEQSTVPGELVADPFAGSGSTIVAAWECDREAWGSEKDSGNYEKTALRLAEYLKRREVK